MTYGAPSCVFRSEEDVEGIRRKRDEAALAQQELALAQAANQQAQAAAHVEGGVR